MEDLLTYAVPDYQQTAMKCDISYPDAKQIKNNAKRYKMCQLFKIRLFNNDFNVNQLKTINV